MKSAKELRDYMFNEHWSYESEQQVAQYLIEHQIARKIDIISYSFMFCNVPVWSLPEEYQPVAFVLDGHVTYRDKTHD